VSTLSNYLNEHLPTGWRKAQLVEALDGSVDRATVYRYLSGKHPRRPSEAVLQAFARALPGTSLVELRRAASVATGAGTPWVPPAAANRLTTRQRRAIEALILATVELDEDEEDDLETAAIELPPGVRADVETYVERLYASGLDELADRVAASLTRPR